MVWVCYHFFGSPLLPIALFFFADFVLALLRVSQSSGIHCMGSKIVYTGMESRVYGEAINTLPRYSAGRSLEPGTHRVNLVSKWVDLSPFETVYCLLSPPHISTPAKLPFPLGIRYQATRGPMFRQLPEAIDLMSEGVCELG